MTTSKTLDYAGLVARVSLLLAELHTPHCLIGGVAVAARGYARATRDVDFLVAMPTPLDTLLNLGTERGFLLADADRELAESGLVFWGVEGTPGARVDLIAAEKDIEHLILQRAEGVFMNAVLVPVITLEDLIAMKLAAGRVQDDADVEELLLRRGPGFDVRQCCCCC